VKGLLDDSVSGGIYAAPAVLDTALITTPLLSGQLAPFVDMKPIGGRRIAAPRLAPMQGGWGVAAGSAIQPMSSAGLMTSVDTPIWPYSAFLELSNELEADSPLDLGAAIIEQFGERLRAELDKVIAVGNGYNQPLGLFNTSGLVAIPSDNGVGGPVTVSDAESLIFGLPLQYRQGWEGSFVGNDTLYRRFRGIQVGPGDERRVFGMGTFGVQDSQSYQLFEYRYRVQNDLPNSKCGFFALKKFRLYVRAGAELIRERGGRQLALSNMQLIGLRARYGGQLVDSNAAALMTDLQG
jgi:HK97 family phage major capsid protein